PLKRQPLFNWLCATRHDPLLVGMTVLAQARVDGFQVGALWKWHEVIPSRISNEILDAAFLPPGVDIGEKRFKPIDAMEMEKYLVLASAMPLQDLKHGWLEVIVDHHARDSTPEFKGMTLADQKGFLPLRREALHKHGSRKPQAPCQKRDFDRLALEFDHRFAKVKLCPLAWRKR